MTTSIASLKLDLQTSWDLRNTDCFGNEEKDMFKILLNAASYFKSIDPENMALLNRLFAEKAKGNQSFLQFADQMRNA